jgi:hypothetical protein
MYLKEVLIEVRKGNEAYKLYLTRGKLTEAYEERMKEDNPEAYERGRHGLMILAYSRQAFIEYSKILEERLKIIDPQFMNEVKSIYNNN